jgi:hypothetical protein
LQSHSCFFTTFSSNITHSMSIQRSLWYYVPWNSWAWWCTTVIPALRRQRQEDCKVKSSPGYIVRINK